MYVSRSDADGVLYHVYPIDDLKGEEAEFEFDLTRHSSWDHYVLRFTLTEKLRSDVDSMHLVCGSDVLSAPVKRMFVERKGSRWYQRFESEVDADRFRAWTRCPIRTEEPRMEVATRVFLPSGHAWKRLAGQLEVIMDLIDLNRSSAKP